METESVNQVNPVGSKASSVYFVSLGCPKNLSRFPGHVRLLEKDRYSHHSAA